MKKEIQIRHRKIGADQPVLICAEVGVTCNYDLKLTKELIDVVKEAGADALKFIFWFPDEIMSDRSIPYTYQTTEGPVTENMYDMLKELTFTLDEWKEIKAYADERDILIFSTVNSPSGVDWAEELGLEAYKLSSWDFNYHTLWSRIAKLGKPMLIDTGPVNTLDVAKVMQLMKDANNDQSVLVHCFHTEDPAEKNMRAIPYLAKAFDTLVGFSPTDQAWELDIVALTLGSVYLEKRLTMSKSLPGHHHILSMEPDEFTRYVTMVRDTQKSLGVEDLLPSQNDLNERKKWFRHLCASRDLKAGEVLTEDMLEGKRPESAGISPEHQKWFIGRTLKRDLRADEAIDWKDV